MAPKKRKLAQSPPPSANKKKRGTITELWSTQSTAAPSTSSQSAVPNRAETSSSHTANQTPESAAARPPETRPVALMAPPARLPTMRAVTLMSPPAITDSSERLATASSPTPQEQESAFTTSQDWSRHYHTSTPFTHPMAHFFGNSAAASDYVGPALKTYVSAPVFKCANSACPSPSDVAEFAKGYCQPCYPSFTNECSTRHCKNPALNNGTGLCHFCNETVPMPCKAPGCTALSHNGNDGYCSPCYIAIHPCSNVDCKSGQPIKSAAIGLCPPCWKLSKGQCTYRGCTLKNFSRKLCRRHARDLCRNYPKCEGPASQGGLCQPCWDEAFTPCQRAACTSELPAQHNGYCEKCQKADEGNCTNEGCTTGDICFLFGRCEECHKAWVAENPNKCANPKCASGEKSYARGMCKPCWHADRREDTAKGICIRPNCTTHVYNKRSKLCRSHYTKDRESRAQECSTPGCENKASGRGMCKLCLAKHDRKRNPRCQNEACKDKSAAIYAAGWCKPCITADKAKAKELADKATELMHQPTHPGHTPCLSGTAHSSCKVVSEPKCNHICCLSALLPHSLAQEVLQKFPNLPRQNALSWNRTLRCKEQHGACNKLTCDHWCCRFTQSNCLVAHAGCDRLTCDHECCKIWVVYVDVHYRSSGRKAVQPRITMEERLEFRKIATIAFNECCDEGMQDGRNREKVRVSWQLMKDSIEKMVQGRVAGYRRYLNKLNAALDELEPEQRAQQLSLLQTVYGKDLRDHVYDKADDNDDPDFDEDEDHSEFGFPDDDGDDLQAAGGNNGCSSTIVSGNHSDELFHYKSMTGGKGGVSDQNVERGSGLNLAGRSTQGQNDLASLFSAEGGTQLSAARPPTSLAGYFGKGGGWT